MKRSAGIDQFYDPEKNLSGELRLRTDVSWRISAFDSGNWPTMEGQIVSRPTRAVIESHLACRRAGDLDGDLAANYAPDVVLLSAEGVHRGHDGVRELAHILRNYVPAGNYSYRQVLVEGEVAMLQWTARGDDTRVHDGADSYLVRDGMIQAQTIHYSTAPRRRAGDA